MAVASELESALLTVLPADFRAHASTLAGLLADAVNGTLSPADFHTRLAAEPALTHTLKALAGRKVEAGGKLFSFSDNEPGGATENVTSEAVRWSDSTPSKIVIALGERSVAANEIHGNVYTGDFYVSVESLAALEPAAAELEKARELLASLPVDVVPPPSAFPSFSSMPMHRNEDFVGRFEELMSLAALLKGHRTVALKPTAKAAAVVAPSVEKAKRANQGADGSTSVAATTGIGGIGKTQLAIEFVHRYGRYFAGGVFWLSFAEPDTIPAQVASFGEAGALNLFRRAGSYTQQEKVRRVYEAWQTPMPRLLVFDNCEDERLLRQWLPTGGGCRVLITSRRGRWSSFFGVKVLELDVLKREESIRLLRRLREDLPGEDYERNTAALDEIAAELGDLPLALHLAGCYMNTLQHHISPSDYLALLRAPPLLQHASMQGSDELSPTDHEQNVARTFRLSYRLLDPTNAADSLALKLLPRSAHFAPGEFIPLGLLRDSAGKFSDQSAVYVYAVAVRRLIEVGILTQNGRDGDVRLHRLLAQFVRQEIEPETDAEARNKVSNLVELILWAPYLYSYAKSLSSLHAHLLAVVNESYAFFLKQRRYDDAVYQLLLLDTFLKRWGGYQDSVGKFEKVQRRIADPHMRILVLLHIGEALQSMGRARKVGSYYDEALKLARANGLREDEAAVLGQSGNYFYETGRIEEALRCYEGALNIVYTLDEKDRDMAPKWHAGKGNCFYSLARTDEAIREVETALTLAAKIADERVAREIRLEGEIIRAHYHFIQGEAESAVNLVSHALGLAKETDDARSESNCLGNLGDYYAALGEYERARECMDEALKMCREFGLKTREGHILHSLAELLIDEGDDETAMRYAAEGIEAGLAARSPKVVSDNKSALARAHLHAGRLDHAHKAIVSASKYPDRSNRAYVLALRGVVELRRSMRKRASQKFEEAERVAASITSSDAKRYRAHYTRGLALCGLALCGLREHIDAAKAAYKMALQINRGAGVLKRNASLLGALSLADDAGLLSEVRALLVV